MDFDLFDDFYNSDYIFKKSKYTSNINWRGSRERKIEDFFGGYSGGFYRSSSSSDIDKTTDLLNKAYKSAKDLIVVLDFPFKLNIYMEKNNYHDSDTKSNRYVFLPTKVIDEIGLSDIDKINIISGLGLHEAAHLKYTELKVYDTYINMTAKKVDSDPDIYIKYETFSLLKVIINLLEDERIEDQLLKERPGFLEFIEKGKNWRYSQLNKYISRYKRSVKEKEVDLIMFISKLLRFNNELTKDDIKNYNYLFKNIQKILVNFPKTTKNTCEISKEILKVIIEGYFNGSDSKEGCLNSFYLKEVTFDLFENFSVFGNINYGFDGEYTIDGSKFKFKTDEVSEKINYNPLISRLVLGIAEKGEGREVFFTKKSGNKSIYLKIKNEIAPLIPSIKKIIKLSDKNYKFNVYGCRSGILDTNKLVEAYQSVPQVYIREGNVVTNESCVCVLIDESGSMSGSKMETARKAAILLNESIGTLAGVNLFIYGHSADITTSTSVDINIYREGKTYKPLYSLSDSKARCQNRDGQAILEVAKRVRKFTKDNCIMFVISDGEPAAGDYYGYSARRDVKDNVKVVERMGFNIIQISIDYVHKVEEMFSKYITLYELSTFPKLLNGIIKKSVLNDKKSVTTIN